MAIELRMQLGDWFKVEKLLLAGNGDDQALYTTWNKIGEYYADRQKWSRAAQYFAQVSHSMLLLSSSLVRL